MKFVKIWELSDMKYRLCDVTNSANTGADAIKRAPIINVNTGLRCLRIGDISQKRNYSEWGVYENN